MHMETEDLLRQGLIELELALSKEQQQGLLAYLDLLTKWNATYNLTAIREPKAMLVQHILDSLAILPYLPAGAVIDVGTGAGLPGIPLAIASPLHEFTLLDSNGKKCRFLTQTKHELQLVNLTVVNARVEEFQGEYSAITSRAFASLGDMLQNTQHLCSNRGLFLAMKGNYPEEEIVAMPREFLLKEVVKLTVPYLAAQRHLVIIGKQRG